MPFYSNISKEMTLQVAVDIDDTTLNVDDASGLPTNYPYNVIIDPYTSSMEVVSVTNKIGNALTVDRGQEDTAGQNHSVGAKLWHGATAADFTNAYSHRIASDGVHGIGGGSDVVGTDTAQTLTLKTMSGLDNFFTDLPASEVTGSFNNMSVGQSNAAAPALTITPNGAATANVVTLGTTVRAESKGLLEAANEPTSNFAQRWYSTNFAGVIASVNNTGRFTCVGVTSTGSIIATGQALTCGSVTASGLVTMNAGGSVPAGQTLTVAGVLSISGTGTISGTTTVTGTLVVSNIANMNGTIAFGAASNVGFANGFSVTAGAVSLGGNASAAGTFTAVNVTASGIANFTGQMQRDGNVANLHVLAGSAPLSANQASGGAAGSQTDLTGCSVGFTVPVGRVATVSVRANVMLSGTVVGALQGIACQLDGVNQGRTPRIAIYTTGTPHALPGAWTFTANAGAHTVKLQYVNTSGTGTVTYDTLGTSMEYQVFY